MSRTVTDIESVRKRAAEKLDIVRIRSGVESTHLNKSTPSSSKTSARAKVCESITFSLGRSC